MDMRRFNVDSCVTNVQYKYANDVYYVSLAG